MARPAPDRRVDAAVEWSDADLAAPCIPIYDPSFWNSTSRDIRVNNNCYNYACNRALLAFSNIGRGSGHEAANTSCADLDAGLRSDGLVPTPADHPDCSECRHQVMMFRDTSGFDWHFYQRNRDGMWSHKVGHRPATNVDQAGRPITDPRAAERGIYTEFCGSYCVDRGLLRLG